ncbi:MAG: glycosyltransferase [Lunatimonas sp.]|uniref:glycosyltransferase n=1 Tax=Lunatimonas sp. TaxID=2060141 RepID=UPI00263B1F32|nr:glycosyltransferase [Lunatimonas sp.]MCC5936966.1 glycosyltransferase [Lunatimonas sp.]
MSEQTPLVSIAICTYNGKKYLAEQLESLLHQSYAPLEIVLVDDRSTDGTWELANHYAERFPQLRALQNSENLGYQKNFEKALGLCRGTFVCASDQDDIWELTKVAKLVSQIGENLLIYHDSEFVDADGQSLGRYMSDEFTMVSGSNPYAFLFFNCVSGHALMVRRSLLESVLPFPSLGVYDHYLAFMASTQGQIAYVPEPLVKHRRHEENATDVLGSRKPKSRYKITQTRMQRENEWLRLCAAMSGHEASHLANCLWNAAKNRTHNLVNPRFGYLVWKHQGRLVQIPKKKSYHGFGFVFRQIWGLKAKSLFKFS